MKLALIIPVFNRKEVSLACLAQLSGQDFLHHEVQILVVDHGTNDATTTAIREQFPDVTTIRASSNLWWSGAINVGVEYALKESFDGVVFLNDDLEFERDTFKNLFAAVDAAPQAMISAIKLEKDRASNLIITAGFQLAGFLQEMKNPYQGKRYNSAEMDELLKADILTGSTLYIPTTVFHAIGGIDEKRFPHNWGDLDFTFRARKAGFNAFVATKSITRTDYNPNYHRFFYLESSKAAYLKNLFDVHRYSYGYRFLFRASFAHRPMLKGVIVYSKGFVRLTLAVFTKCLSSKTPSGNNEH